MSGGLRRCAAGLAAALLALSGCGEDEMGPTTTPESGTIQLSLTGFPAFASGEGVFELWISFADPGSGGLRHTTTASAGRFKIKELGQIVGIDYQPITFAVDVTDPDVPLKDDGTPIWELGVDAFVTIEPAEDPLPDQPGPAFLGGDFLNGAAALDPASGDAFLQNLDSAAGSFLMATPTTSSTADESEGIWFVTPGGLAKSLTLPLLPPRWTYEAWVSVGSAGIKSLGRLNSATGPDSDGPGPLGPLDGSGYAFPGSDFPFGGQGTDLAAGSVFLTVEPAGNPDGAEPFFLQILSGAIPPGTSPGVPVPMVNRAGSLPRGTVTLPRGR